MKRVSFCYIGYIGYFSHICCFSYKPMSQPMARISACAPTWLLAFSYVTDVTGFLRGRVRDI